MYYANNSFHFLAYKTPYENTDAYTAILLAWLRSLPPQHLGLIRSIRVRELDFLTDGYTCWIENPSWTWEMHAVSLQRQPRFGQPVCFRLFPEPRVREAWLPIFLLIGAYSLDVARWSLTVSYTHLTLPTKRIV